jgi:hypothetical protein
VSCLANQFGMRFAASEMECFCELSRSSRSTIAGISHTGTSSAGGQIQPPLPDHWQATITGLSYRQNEEMLSDKKCS